VPNQGATIGTDWGRFTQVFSGGDGILYAVDAIGDLRWYKDTHRDGTLMDGHVPNQGAIIGIGWNMYTTVISCGDGVIFGRDTAGNLAWYKDLARNGTSKWDPRSAKVAWGFDPTSYPRLFSGGIKADGDVVIYAIDSRDGLRFYSWREHAGSAPTRNNNGVGLPIGPGWPEPRGPAEGAHSRRERTSVPAPPGAAKDHSVAGTTDPVGDGKRTD
jgi:hypothetical protein